MVINGRGTIYILLVLLIESPPLYENLTARENLQVRTTVLGLPKSRIDEVLHVVELENTDKKSEGFFYGDEATIGNCDCIAKPSEIFNIR